MNLSKKTFIYSSILVGTIVSLIIIYFVVMLPSLYIDHLRKSHYQSIKKIQENYRHVYKMDTLKINFEAISPISIPPHDSLGMPCVSAVNRKVHKNDIMLKDGFLVINVKSKEIVPKTLNYRVKQMHDFQLYKKWGKKNNKVEL